MVPTPEGFAHFDLLSEEIVLLILDFLYHVLLDRKSSLVYCSFHTGESHHQKFLRPLCTEHLPTALAPCPNAAALDMSLCPRVTDASLAVVAAACEDAPRITDSSPPSG